jgi:hypothetical protein
MNVIVRQALIAIAIAVVVVAIADFVIWETIGPDPTMAPDDDVTGD